MTEIAGPAWDNSTEYSGLNAPDYQKDFKEVESLIAQIEESAQKVAPFLAKAETISLADAKPAIALCQKCYLLEEKVSVLRWNLSTFAMCELSVDGKNEVARREVSTMQVLASRLSQAMNPVSLFLLRAPQAVLQEFLSNPELKSHKFVLEFERKQSDFLLSLEEESLLSSLSLNGIMAWGNLYSTVSSNLVCEIDLPEGKKKVGMAEATGYLRNDNEAVRKAAYVGRNAAWASQEDVCASALNAIAGWRLDEYKSRSKKRNKDFLDAPLHDNRIERATLDAMLGAVADYSAKPKKALRLAAQMLGKEKLDVWDLSAPAPMLGRSGELEKTPFDKGVEMVANAFAEVHPDMGKFVNMMKERKWLEGRILPNKRHGAYCTVFGKSRSPRVYQTYMGTTGDIQTLAHELGHAFHFWEMRDLPLAEISVPMTLAETASIFAETVSSEALLRNSSSVFDEFQASWLEAQNATVLLLNIPARYEFEKQLYEQRARRTLSAGELKELAGGLFQKHYGDAVNMGGPSLLWASTLHYYISSLSFYNFPYTFGYLFSLGVYAQWPKRGKDFYQSYVSLLRDTGRMTAEELVQKHLGMDIRKREFWNDSLEIVGSKLERFQSVCQKILLDDDRR